MFCNKCGNKINPGEGFCTQCGTPAQGGIAPEVGAASTTISPDDNKKANMLCIISVTLKYGVGLILGLIVGFTSGFVSSTYHSSYTGMGLANTIMSSITFLSGLAAFVLMIIVRVKYPKNIFGKVLMWIYIVEIVIAIIAFAIVIISCAYALRSCS